ncbi:dihydroorotate oxidase A [Dongia mobilis]|uniref:Dihydroorotate dehydrogenase (quinone) n=1 Tax=Dongia mobilis TaxID=578943 RepID=A0A4R6WRJ0_9PROT|nr:quinone-dependent dihydroorotate dehydrogenase [Dongia mobilis]TDQ82081.1 dihydroorotate oxidase A [Dongia mobilis]
MIRLSDLYPLLRPLLFRLDAERAHRLAVRALAGCGSGGQRPADTMLAQRIWGRHFPNPIGLAAGFDKNAECYAGALGLGFGFVEIGSVTPLPQAGNPRPRLFRLPQARAVVNRMGFNNDGMEAVAARLAARDRAGGIVGVNLGKNKETADAAADYEKGIACLGPFADYLVINVSSPNTPGLRALQGRAPLAALIDRARAARDALPVAPNGGRPPLLLKIAPDLTAEDRVDIAEVALGRHGGNHASRGLDGLIISNTTIERPAEIGAAWQNEAGGLSGAPLFGPSTALLRDMYRLTEGRLPLIGVGGIASAAEAYAKIRAGASLVQLYSALVYEGPGLPARIARELPALLAQDGFGHVAEVVGADHR